MTTIGCGRPAVADELGLDEEAGVVILSVRNSSMSANLGFRAGDIIAKVGNTPIADVAGLEGALRQRQKVWQMTVKRGGRLMQLQLSG